MIKSDENVTITLQYLEWDIDITPTYKFYQKQIKFKNNYYFNNT